MDMEIDLPLARICGAVWRVVNLITTSYCGAVLREEGKGFRVSIVLMRKLRHGPAA